MSDDAATTYTELAVALGRVEGKVTRLVDMEERLRKVEQTVERIEASTPARTPWYVVVGGVFAIVGTLAAVIALVALFARIGS